MSPSVQKMPTKLRLKLANECEDVLAKTKLETTKKEFRFYMAHSKQISLAVYDKMMTLFEPLMRDMYEKSSWGWNEHEKLAEWKHSRTRVIFVTKSSEGESSGRVLAGLPPQDDEIIGFMCIRFEVGADKKESALYVYELHIHSNFQRQGLGEELMGLAKNVAVAFKMDKIMLTVFKSNSQALKFYNKLKYRPDTASETSDFDYCILSQKLKYH